MEATLRSKRRSQRGRLTIELNAAKTLLAQPTLNRNELNAVGHHLTKIHSKTSELKGLDDEIAALLADCAKFYDDACEYIDSVETQYLELKQEYDEQRATLSHTTTGLHASPPTPGSSTGMPLPVATTMTSGPKQRAHLPKLQLPMFYGDALQWLAFLDHFNAAVDADTSLAPVQKLQYLRAQLAGDAAKVIDGLPLTNASYDEAMDLLKTRYGKTDRLVNAYIQAILDVKSPTNEVNSLRRFHDNIETYIRGLRTLGKADAADSDMLVSIVQRKIPGQVKTQMHRDHAGDAWTIQELMTALSKEIEANSAGGFTNMYDVSTDFSTATFYVNSRPRPDGPPRSPRRPHRCAFCKQEHMSYTCTVVTDANKRADIVKRDRLCYNCLSRNHDRRDCPSKFSCRSCGERHHTTICGTSLASGNQTTQTQRMNSKPKVRRDTHVQMTTRPTDETPTGIQHEDAHVKLTPTSGPVLLKTATATIRYGSTHTQVNILLDEGSQRTFVSQKAAERLKIKPSDCCTETINLATFGSDKTSQQHHAMTTLELETRQGIVNMSAIIVPTISTPIKNYVPTVLAQHDYLAYLPTASHVTDPSIHIDLLIGADYYWSIVHDTTVRGQGPTAVDSKLGYLLSGPTNTPADATTLNTTCMRVMTDSNPEENMASIYWDLEAIGIADNPKEASFDYADYYANSIQHDDDGKYTARLPWKVEHDPLPTNYAITKARTRSTIQRLDTGTLELYDKIVQDQLDRDFIEPVPNDDPAQGHYLPHHPVKKDSATTPIRIVYDCSCATRQHPSLNDCLETGTPLLNDLVSMLIRFRTKKVAFTSDIEKAFLNVRLHEADRNYTKFMWLSDPGNPDSAFQVYRFKSVLFGSRSSPFILNTVVKKHLDNYDDAVTSDIQQNIYVDNILSGVTPAADSTDCTQQAINYYNRANEVMQHAGFKLRSWATNDPTLQATMARDGTADTNSTVNVLGLKWNINTDYITYSAQTRPDCNEVTKRQILKTTASLFDPLGLLSPVHVKAKILIQQLWLEQRSWDEPLPSTLCDQWNSISKDLSAARSTTIPRQLFTEFTDKYVELHIFCDASTKAYGAAAYLKRGDQAALVMAKTRVKPTKDITLPRLELMATLIGARLSNFITASLSQSDIQITKRVLWTDSQITLHWILCNKKLPVFVANRVREIQQAQFDNVKYCPTTDNPADLLTRGISTDSLQSSKQWWYGPDWLPAGDWPINSTPNSTVMSCLADSCDLTQITGGLLPDVQPSTQTTENSTPSSITQQQQQQPEVNSQDSDLTQLIDPARFSTIDKLLRVTCYVLHFVAVLRKKQSSFKPKVDDLNKAELMWTKSIQQRHYKQELQVLQGKTMRCPLIRQLRLFLDDDNIIRCGGRLQNASVKYEAKHPILVPPNDPVTVLFIRRAHTMVLHAGLLTTITYIRQSHWIPRIRQVVKTELRRCITCLKVNGRPYATPISPPLPECRLREASAFSVTGVDFTGTLYYKNSTSKQTSVMFACLPALSPELYTSN